MKRLSVVLLLSIMINVSHAQLAIRGETVYTMAGKPLRNAVILVKGGKIEQVLEGAMVKLPEGYKVMEAKVVTPGLVDAHTVVGLTGIFNQKHDQMQLETSEPVQPELRAIDAYNPQEQLIEFVRNLGVTTMHTGHAPGALASGTTIVVK
ncbi:amidohydrolase, partial [Sphingobacteriales bacterium CHB3]|nr:amidohydrolase [Sphingobacteriales bacterium CHB3]